MPLKCYFHPNEDAIYECGSCGKPICGDCMRFNDDDTIVCPACTLEYAMDIADDDQREHMDRRHRLMEERQRKKTKIEDKLALINGWYIIAILLLIGLNVFMHRYIDQAGAPAEFDTERFAAMGDPALEITYITSKVFKFAEEHDGTFPNKLHKLFPEYLEALPAILGTSEQYSFTPVASGEKFVLSLPRADRYGYRRLYVTGDGILRTE